LKTKRKKFRSNLKKRLKQETFLKIYWLDFGLREGANFIYYFKKETILISLKGKVTETENNCKWQKQFNGENIFWKAFRINAAICSSENFTLRISDLPKFLTSALARLPLVFSCLG